MLEFASSLSFLIANEKSYSFLTVGSTKEEIWRCNIGKRCAQILVLEILQSRAWRKKNSRNWSWSIRNILWRLLGCSVGVFATCVLPNWYFSYFLFTCVCFLKMKLLKNKNTFFKTFMANILPAPAPTTFLTWKTWRNGEKSVLNKNVKMSHVLSHFLLHVGDHSTFP